MLRIGWLIVVDWPEPPLTYAALAPHGAQPGPVFPAQGPVGIPWVIHGGRLLAIPRRSFYSNSFKHYPLVIEIYGIKIRHRSRCLRPSVWPTPAADNRLPVRWTRAVDTNHTAAHAASALKTDPEPLRFALHNRRICTASGPYWRYALRRWGRARNRRRNKGGNRNPLPGNPMILFYDCFLALGCKLKANQALFQPPG